MIDISPADEAIVNEILKKYVPKFEVRVFGSRHKWTTKSYSDLYIAIVGDAKLDKQTLYVLQEAFEESELNFRVDVLDWYAISDEFRAIIEQGYTVIQEKENEKQLPAGWVVRRLGDVVDCYDKLRTPLSSIQRELRKGIFPYYGAQGIIDNIDDYIFDGIYILIAEDGENLRSRKQPIANIAKGRFWVNNHAHVLRNNENSDFAFIYYYLNFINISAFITGAAQPKLNQDNLFKIPVLCPPIEEQKKIAAILSSLDDKIELNQQINKKLEETAQSIFKEWFIDFNFPDENGNPYRNSGGAMIDSELGFIPASWSVGKLGDYVKVKSGFAFKSSWWVDSGVSVVKIKDITNYTIDFSDLSCINKIHGDLASEFRLSKGDLVIAMTGATIGKFGIIPKTEKVLFANQRVGKFFLGSNPIQKLGFLYCNLLQENVIYQINAYANGAAQPNISPSSIESISMNVPNNEKLINNFNDIVKTMFEKICDNLFEINQLKLTRDTLLPKLMSGEIRL